MTSEILTQNDVIGEEYWKFEFSTHIKVQSDQMIENLRLAVEEEQRQTHDLLTTNVQLKKAVDDLTETNKLLTEEKNSEILQLRSELQKAEELNKGRF